MARLEFNEQMQVGIKEVDDQHMKLFEIYNDLDKAMSIGRGQKEMKAILDQLVVYTKEHFQAEEKLMETEGYPTLEAHRVEHAQLIDKVARFQKKFDLGLERISKPVMEFLNFWLKIHIMHSDMEFGEYTRTQPDSGAETTDSSKAPALNP